MTVAYSDIIRTAIITPADHANLIDAGSVIWGGTSGGSANAQTITTSPTVTTLSTGLRIGFIAGFTTTSTTPTINVNSTSAVTTKRGDASVSIIGDIYAGQYHEIIYNSSNWLVMNPASVWTTWTPTLTGFSANPTNTSYRYCVIGRTCLLEVRQGATGTSSTTGFTLTLPITASSTTNGFWGSICWQAYDNGATKAAAIAYISASGTTVGVFPDAIGGSWTAAGGKMASFNLSYEV